MKVVSVTGPGTDADAVRDVFLEYGESLGFNTCFGGFELELIALPGDYAPPRGRLLLAGAGTTSSSSGPVTTTRQTQ